MTLEISNLSILTKLGDDMKAEVLANLAYLRKKYRVFNDPDAYFGNERKGIAPSQEYLENRRRAANYYLILLITIQHGNFIKKLLCGPVKTV